MVCFISGFRRLQEAGFKSTIRRVGGSTKAETTVLFCHSSLLLIKKAFFKKLFKVAESSSNSENGVRIGDFSKTFLLQGY